MARVLMLIAASITLSVIATLAATWVASHARAAQATEVLVTEELAPEA